MQEVGLIHMGGRVYDPVLARFISADPHIQADSLSQSYNRYSYVLNNPLKYTDPSGYFFARLFNKIGRALKQAWNAVRPFVGIIASLATVIWCPLCGASILNAALTGAVVGALGAAAR